MPRVLTRRQISATSITIVVAASTSAPAVVVRIAAQSLGTRGTWPSRPPPAGRGRSDRLLPLVQLGDIDVVAHAHALAVTQPPDVRERHVERLAHALGPQLETADYDHRVALAVVLARVQCEVVEVLRDRLEDFVQHFVAAVQRAAGRPVDPLGLRPLDVLVEDPDDPWDVLSVERSVACAKDVLVALAHGVSPDGGIAFGGPDGSTFEWFPLNALRTRCPVVVDVAWRETIFATSRQAAKRGRVSPLRRATRRGVNRRTSIGNREGLRKRSPLQRSGRTGPGRPLRP
jgi:hypothetical protein